MSLSVDRALRLVFLGTPEFAVPSLRALVEAGHEVALVVTPPDKPRGRGRHTEPCAVKREALRLGLTVASPDKVNAPEFVAHLHTRQLDLGIVVAFGHLLSGHLLSAPRHGFLNVHGSLLPRWRGAAPIQRGLLAGDVEFGVTVQCVAEKMDAGDILLAEGIAASDDDTLGSLETRLAPIGARLLVAAVEQFASGQVRRIAQNEELVTIAPSIRPGEGRISWTDPAERIVRMIRAFNPRPIAWTTFGGDRLSVLRARVVPGSGAPGCVVSIPREGPEVAAGEAVIRLEEVQSAGRRRMSGRDWANGVRLVPGARFE